VTILVHGVLSFLREKSLVTAAGVTGVLGLVGLSRAGRAIPVGGCAGALPMPGVTAMPAMRAVHEEVATHHQSDETVVDDCTNGYLEDENGRQRCDQAKAQNPNNGWDVQWTISCGGIVFHRVSP
jgi:hypothetical protein